MVRIRYVTHTTQYVLRGYVTSEALGQQHELGAVETSMCYVLRNLHAPKFQNLHKLCNDEHEAPADSPPRTPEAQKVTMWVFFKIICCNQRTFESQAS